ncbi:hypothetical protein [Bradyrhizobium sp. CCBAU 53421]|uniref:hypothetical protein n=1 Tax=Bradyrhizobium sp. CCBAU 53421 TaxID=1325120 RepID=UPI00188C28A3|nr:hypothetical protein [Bradyrhizobium sp. CCBAU 53421]
MRLIVEDAPPRDTPTNTNLDGETSKDAPPNGSISRSSMAVHGRELPNPIRARPIDMTEPYGSNWRGELMVRPDGLHQRVRNDPKQALELVLQPCVPNVISDRKNQQKQ